MKVLKFLGEAVLAAGFAYIFIIFTSSLFAGVQANERETSGESSCMREGGRYSISYSADGVCCDGKLDGLSAG